MSAFHDIRLPLAFSLGATGGPAWRTDLVALASGGEFRNSPLSASRRRWDIGGAIRNLADVAELTAFFEARRGRLHGFRFRDLTDNNSAAPDTEVTALDQPLGVGDGFETTFQLVKQVESGGQSHARRITRPVPGTVRIALDGVEQLTGWAVDDATGRITFNAAPETGVVITAGFAFDIPARFDTDQLDISIDAIGAGRLASVPVIELLE